MSDTTIRPADITGFWRDAGPERWFARSDAFDAQCARFRDAHFAAAQRQFEDWMHSAEGALGLLLLLDQIPRNLFRGNAHAYATDPLARHYASRALGLGMDMQVDAAMRPFLYLPFEHSEDLLDQEHSLRLFAALGAPAAEEWARLHHDIIVRFGRFPHRNAALGRASTPTEQAFLDGGGFGG